MRVAPKIELTDEERAALTKLIRSKLTSVRLAQRARIVLLAAQGLQNKEIAARLGISERTVKAHLASIYGKLGVDSRAAAIAVAAQRGLLGN